MINPPLASTAVGVVAVDAGRAWPRGVNSTFRQVGIATGIAALGSIFSHQVADAVRPALLRQGPVVGARAAHRRPLGRAGERSGGGRAAGGAASGGQSAGQQAFDLVNNAGTSAVVDALNHITLIAAVIAFAAAVLCLVLIRQKDFVVRGGPPPAPPPGADEPSRSLPGRAVPTPRVCPGEQPV